MNNSSIEGGLVNPNRTMQGFNAKNAMDKVQKGNLVDGSDRNLDTMQ
jgi:hypothetical protein